MDDPLVDAEGFPRNDIDINQVRLARNRIICKETTQLVFNLSINLYVNFQALPMTFAES